MKYVQLILAVILTQFSVMAHDISVATEFSVEVSSDEGLSSRLYDLLTEATNMTAKFDSIKGPELAKKFESKWKDKIENKDINRVADEMLISKLKEIRDAKKDNKEIKIECVYEACRIFQKYETGDNKLPTCIILLLKDPTSAENMKSVVVNARRQLEDVAVAEKIEDK